MWMWCLRLSVVCCSLYTAVCTIQFSPFASEVCIVWVWPPSPQVEHPPSSSHAMLPVSTSVICWTSCLRQGSHQSQICGQIAGNDVLWLTGSLLQAKLLYHVHLVIVSNFFCFKRCLRPGLLSLFCSN